jgi:hypothetical protein
VIHCEANPLHPPAGFLFTTAAVDSPVTPLCEDCLKARVAAAVDHGEDFQAGTLEAIFPTRWVVGASP